MPAITLADLAERYMRAHVAVNCNAHTAGIYRGSLDNHILPALGTLALEEAGREQIAALHYELRNTPRAANRVLMILSKMFVLAEAWGLVAAGGNPCRHVVRYKQARAVPDKRRLGRELAALEAEGRVQMLTGCRLNEILTLRWDDVDHTAGELRLRDGKTGARMVPLTPTAAAVLEGIARVPGSPWVIAWDRPEGHLSYLSVYWYRVRERAELDDVFMT